ncbi:MAG: NAD-dependent epimerase/dehydratase family protein [Thermoproteus sp. AZ2]|jgi:nucleoside-diphosphate-sugar epimerase|uniref:NAD-dependent epimerase/dehydratase family protein n=1 Tax=Thermoproteus sp. AZ2 TaxID=1609232 RepID=A0ACC6V2N3_9CREN
MRILVYGGLGFIGANLAEALAGLGEVYVAHRPGSPQRRPRLAQFVSRYARPVEYRDPAEPLKAVNPDVIYNLVGEYFGPPEKLAEANVEFPRRLCGAAREAGWDGAVVHVSAATVVGPKGGVIAEEPRHLEGISPASDFDRQKAEGERIVAGCFRRWVIVRPALVYGRFNDHPEWAQLVSIIRRGVVPLIRAKVSAISVRELAKALASAQGLKNEYFFAAECSPRPLSQFAEAIAEALGGPRVKMPIPAALLKAAAPRELRRHMPFLDKAFSCEKMKRLLGYEPRPDFEREVRDMVDYILGRP